MKYVEVIGLEAPQGFFSHPQHTCPGKVESVQVVAGALRCENHLATAVLQCFAQASFGQSTPVIGRHVEEVDSCIDCGVNGSSSLCGIGGAVLVTAGGGAQNEPREKSAP